MEDWSSVDPTRNFGGVIYMPPSDDGGIYLNEGYDDLGRRRPDMPTRRYPAGGYTQTSGYRDPTPDTHWSAAQASHWPAALETPGCRMGREPPRGAPASAVPPRNSSTKEGFVGFHESDREQIQPIYEVAWDQRPASYNPNAGPQWARLGPPTVAEKVPRGCAAAYPGVPTTVDGIPAQAWAQNIPWAAGPPTWGSSKENFSSSGSSVLSVTADTLQLVFLFIILVVLSMILREMKQRTSLENTTKPPSAGTFLSAL